MQVKFNRRTFGSEMRAEDLKEAILSLVPDAKRPDEKYQIAAANAAILAVHLVQGSLKLDKVESGIEEYKALTNILAQFDPDDAECTWRAYGAVDDEEILPLLIQAYRDAHKPLAPREQVDSKYLTDKEKAALDDPSSPLVSPGEAGS